MSAWLVALVTLIYATVSVLQFCKGGYQDALMWSGYTLANLGLIWRYWGD